MVFEYKHYVRVDANGRVVKGFSAAIEPPQAGDVCINEQGGYQFRLTPEGAENPELRDDNGVLLYKWDGAAVVARTPQEIAVDTPAQEPPRVDPLQKRLDEQEQRLDGQEEAILELAGMIAGGGM